MEFKNILIVDDSSTSRLIMRKCIEIAGFSESNFFNSENGLEGLDILENNKIDLIVTDLNMPKMDGDNFIKKIKQIQTLASIPIIVVTSLSNDILIDELKKIGVFGIIKKPISPEKILDIIGE